MVFLPSTIPSRMARTNQASALQPGGDPGPVSVFFGVDTHRDFHVAVALSLQAPCWVRCTCRPAWLWLRGTLGMGYGAR